MTDPAKDYAFPPGMAGEKWPLRGSCAALRRRRISRNARCRRYAGV